MQNGGGVFFTPERKLERAKDTKAGWRGTVRCVGSGAAPLCVPGGRRRGSENSKLPGGISLATSPGQIFGHKTASPKSDLTA